MNKRVGQVAISFFMLTLTACSNAGLWIIGVTDWDLEELIKQRAQAEEGQAKQRVEHQEQSKPRVEDQKQEPQHVENQIQETPYQKICRLLRTEKRSKEDTRALDKIKSSSPNLYNKAYKECFNIIFILK